jgi:hypothetical protein
MNIQELHYSFNLKVDKVDSLNEDSFNDVERDWILNYAISVFVKQRFGTTNVKKGGLETSTKRIDDLRSLHKKQFEITPTLYSTNLYEAALNNITNPSTLVVPKDYWFTTRLRADVRSGTCTKNVGVNTTQTDDLNEALTYKFYKPSFKWGRLLATFNDDSVDNENPDDILGSIFLHTDSFEVVKLYIDYIKMPNRVWLGTYNTLDGNYVVGNNPIQCDLPDHTHEELTTLAAKLAQELISDPTFQQLRQQYIELE